METAVVFDDMIQCGSKEKKKRVFSIIQTVLESLRGDILMGGIDCLPGYNVCSISRLSCCRFTNFYKNTKKERKQPAWKSMHSGMTLQNELHTHSGCTVRLVYEDLA